MLQRERGVTLIELMTVMLVLAILASIAVPSYRSYLLRAQRTDAKTSLLQVQAAEEKFYLQANKYTKDVTSAPPAGLGLTSTSSNGYYDVLVDFGTSGDDQTFLAKATPIAGKGQSDDIKCTQFSIDDTGKRDASGPGGRDYCWR
jgi:type IV pilus assembly protein PilE